MFPTPALTLKPVVKARPLSRLRRVVVGCALTALVSLTLEFGFDEPPVPVVALVAVQLAAVAVYITSRVYQVVTAPAFLRALGSCWIDGVLLLGAAVFLFVRLELSARPVLNVATVYVGAIQVVLLVRLAIEGVRLNLLLSQTKLQPTRFIALTFLSLIVLGTLALALPKATERRVRERPEFSLPRHVVNCAFTATSATCVTGLIVYDTGADFTRLGQVIILVLIQAGGLGIMIFGSVLGLLVGRQLSLRHSLVMQDAMSHKTLGQMRAVIVFIVLFTFAAEALGAILLYPMWQGTETVRARVFFSVFHAVSAFCNAGFALQADSLVGYRGSWQVYGCIMPLIVLGGLGFPVLRDLSSSLMTRLRRRLASRVGVRLSQSGPVAHRLTLHSKLVLLATAFLIVIPVGLFVVFESTGLGAPASPAPGYGDTMAQASILGRVRDALFLSITCRTAGFNTVATNPNALSPASHMLSVILMFIGGSPASTAGGIKTVGLAVLLLSVWTTLRGRRHIEAFGRTIPDTVARRAAVVVVVMFLLISLVVLTLCFTEGASLRVVLFEAASACGTVGLSTGLTPELTIVGRFVIMLAMFAGRLGPLTLLIALAGAARPERYEYPMEQVGIG